eukprot:TRINITY_DN287_c0_g6_i2.p1 TRINITY_DN287_c0_g6~~TRINITY_DN287_c0_g6_i2.p1  ORF type:complete len:193 (+),score=12.91 TRINITY_DN287_c0_g6_i2:153-731(+)
MALSLHPFDYSDLKILYSTLADKTTHDYYKQLQQIAESLKRHSLLQDDFAVEVDHASLPFNVRRGTSDKYFAQIMAIRLLQRVIQLRREFWVKKDCGLYYGQCKWIETLQQLSDYATEDLLSTTKKRNMGCWRYFSETRKRHYLLDRENRENKMRKECSQWRTRREPPCKRQKLEQDVSVVKNVNNSINFDW